MKINTEMSRLLGKAGLQWPVTDKSEGESPKLEIVEDSVLLWGERNRNIHVKISDFPDKTGFECFLNHVHLPFNGTKESLASCLAYAAGTGKALAPFTKGRSFRVIVAISNGDCTVRFHQVRLGENWLSADVEGYKSEAVLVFDVDG